jgi:hypothetical protein
MSLGVVTWDWKSKLARHSARWVWKLRGTRGAHNLCLGIYVRLAPIYLLISAIWSSFAVPRLGTATLYKGALESVSGARNEGSNERKDERFTIAFKQSKIVQNNQRESFD